jgi:predicted alpha/beta superfamily hydrolase
MLLKDKMTRFLIACFILCTSHFCYAQSPITIGTAYQFNSKILKENRTLNIYTPEGYHNDSAKTYPVIYLLDGSINEDFIHTVGVVQFLTMIGSMPESIIVGIANVDRRRDFTFPTTIEKDKKDFPTTGSSAKFIDFIAGELQPFIAEKFKVNGVKTIIGQSLGGLLATEILIKRGNLFNNYIIVSPSLWWDNQSLLTKTVETVNAQQLKDVKVCIMVGEEGKIMVEDAKSLGETLSKIKALRVNFEFLEKEDHLTILHHAVYQSLLKLYKKDG